MRFPIELEKADIGLTVKVYDVDGLAATMQKWLMITSMSSKSRAMIEVEYNCKNVAKEVLSIILDKLKNSCLPCCEK